MLTPAAYIRISIFGVQSQEDFGRLLGYSQAHVCRWEGGMPISRPAQERIRALAAERGIAWDNNWFFEVPQAAHPAAA